MGTCHRSPESSFTYPPCQSDIYLLHIPWHHHHHRHTVHTLVVPSFRYDSVVTWTNYPASRFKLTTRWEVCPGMEAGIHTRQADILYNDIHTVFSVDPTKTRQRINPPLASTQPMRNIYIYISSTKHLQKHRLLRAVLSSCEVAFVLVGLQASWRSSG